MRFIRVLCVFLTFLCAGALARLGETADQFAARYGPPKDGPSSEVSDRNFPLLEGAIHHIYDMKDGEFERHLSNRMVPQCEWNTRSFSRPA